jgi:hypothetical protein
MKRWEDAAAALVEPMIKGQPARLTVDQQFTVATWAAMKAAVFEYAWVRGHHPDRRRPRLDHDAGQAPG